MNNFISTSLKQVSADMRSKMAKIESANFDNKESVLDELIKEDDIVQNEVLVKFGEESAWLDGIGGWELPMWD